MSDYSIIAVTGWSAARALAAAVLATGLGVLIARESRRAAPAAHGMLWVLLLATIVSPDLVAGYAYANFSLSLARWPAANEAVLTLLIASKATAVAAVVAVLTPAPALSPGGRHLLRLTAGRVGWRERWRILSRGRLDRLGPVFAISFLFAFQQFELPSLTNTTAWTVTIFDRQALLPDLADSADPLVWPMLVELLVLVPLVFFLARAVRATRRAVEPARTVLVSRLAAWGVAVVVALFSVAVPWLILTREAVGGVGYFRDGGPAVMSYVQQVGTALLLGVLSGGLAWIVALGMLRLMGSTRWSISGGILLMAICLPGLCGPLVPSLFAVELLQNPMLLPLRDSIFPAVVVLALMLVPRAVLLEVLSRLDTKRSATDLAAMLRHSPNASQRRAGREQLWALRGFGRFCRVSLLMYWGYLDLTVSKMLSPTGMESVTLWLYNFMHYGRNASLSAMTFVAMLVPVLLFLGFLAARRVILKMF